MSRTPSGSRPVISQPQPYNPRSLPGEPGPYPSFQRPQNASDNRPASPMRPVRSLRRAPSDSVNSSSNLRPAPRDHLAPVESSRRGSAEDEDGGMLYSPISPAAPNTSGSSGTFQDPWAADRSQRSELLAQSSASALRPANRGAGGPGSDKLRNVVGAFMSASKSKGAEEPKRPGKSDERARAAKQARDRDLDVGGGEDGEQFAEIDGVLRKIKKDWPFVMDSDFSPSTLALSLLSSKPSASLPEHPSLNSFLRLHSSLSTSLQSAVQSHFQSFAASLPAHAQFLATLNRAQQQVRLSKDSLKEARDGFAGKGKTELASIRVRERMVRDMLRILDEIDHLKQIPDQLESLIGDKRFLQAAILLVRSLKMINKPEMMEIGAVADLRAYLLSQESALVDILIEELHQHLYLKTFYCDSRWSSYTPGQQDLSGGDLNVGKPSSKKRTTPPATTAGGASSRLSRYLNSLSIKPSRDPLLDVADADLDHAIPTLGHKRNGGSIASISAVGPTGASHGTPNPEADSFGYIESLLEASAALGKLGVVIDVMAQRVGSELYAMVESTLEEVEERTEQRKQDHTAELTTPSHSGSRSLVDTSFTPSQSLRMAVALDAAGPPLHAVILKDLFWTLYSKLAAVLEGHRVVFEVARWIATRRDFKDASLTAMSTLSAPVMEVWKPMRQEVRTLLHNYLTDDDRTTFTRNQLMSINEVLKDSKVARDKQKQMFKFSDTDTKAMMKDIKEHDDSLNHTLLASVPGLVNPSSGESAQQALATALSTSDDRYSSVGRHRQLIPSNAFNISTLFQPTSAFLTRVSDIIPPGYENETDHFGGVLEDFVVKVFLPQLEEKVTASFQQAVGGLDAFVPDASMTQTERPPVQSAAKVIALVQSLCSMLLTTPFHRENYSRLIVGVIVQYYQQCSTHFRDVASLPQAGGRNITKLALSASWAQRSDFSEILSRTLEVLDSAPFRANDFAQREVKLAINLLDGAAVPEKELIPSRRNLEQLGNLYHSLRWFITQLLEIKSVADEPLSPGADADELELLQPSLATIPEALDGTPKLPLTRAMAQRYDAIIQTYEQLANMVLFTMRLEFRCRVVYHIDAALSNGNYRIEYDAFEPDPHVMDLNADLVECDEMANETLPSKERRFLFQGLGLLMDTMLVVAARKVKSINAAGVQKIRRNILALQQSLRSVLSDPAEADFSRSTTYWDLYATGPKDMMEGIRINGPAFSFEDYNTMLNLQCKVDQSQAADSDLNSYLIDLHALSMSGEGWDEA